MGWGIAAALLLAVVLVVGRLALGGSKAQMPVESPSHALRTVALTGLGSVGLFSAPTEMQTSSAAAPAPPASSAGPIESPAPPGQIRVCGQGLVDAAVLEGEQKPAWDAQWQRAAAALQQLAVQRLQASANDLDRVAAALLAGDVDAAARIAYRSGDATAYGIALTRCKPEVAACGLLSAARWAQMEPGNAAPWIAMAYEAMRRGDNAGQLEGLHRAALATRLDFGYGQIVGQVAAALPQIAWQGEVPREAAEGSLLVSVIGYEAAAAVPGYLAISSACSAVLMRDSNRRQLCQATARTMLKQGRTLLDLGIGLGLAERAGIPAKELPLSRAELDAGMKWLTESAFGPPDQMLGCEALARIPRHLAAVAQRGEWGVIQQGLKASQAASAAVTKP